MGIQGRAIKGVVRMTIETKTLVDRLKGKYEMGPNAEFGTRDFSKFVPPISLEAAARIRELEGVLHEVMFLYSGLAYSDESGYMAELDAKIREALS